VSAQDIAAMSAGDLPLCFEWAQAVVNSSMTLGERNHVVAALEKAADDAEERLVRMANETRAAFHAAQQVGKAGMQLLLRRVAHLKLVASQGVATAEKALVDATSADPSKYQTPVDTASLYKSLMDLKRGIGRAAATSPPAPAPPRPPPPLHTATTTTTATPTMTATTPNAQGAGAPAAEAGSQKQGVEDKGGGGLKKEQQPQGRGKVDQEKRMEDIVATVKRRHELKEAEQEAQRERQLERHEEEVRIQKAAARKVAREVAEREKVRERQVRDKIAAQKRADAEERERERQREKETREKISGALGNLLIHGGRNFHGGRGRGRRQGRGGVGGAR